MNTETIRKLLKKKSFPFRQYDVMLSSMLFAALEHMVIEHCIEQKRTIQELHHLTQIEVDKLNLLLETLRILSIIEEEDKYYKVVDAAIPLFLEDNPNYIGNQLNDNKEYWKSLLSLEQYFSPNYIHSKKNRNEKQTQAYLSSVLEFNSSWIDEFVQYSQPCLKNAKSVLDIGGGHGMYSSKILEFSPETKITILDLKNAIHHCQSLHKKKSYYSQLNFIEGSILELEIQEKFDVVMIHDLLHYFTLSEKSEILSKAYNSLEKGGHLLISKFHLTEGDACLSPTHAFCFSIKNFVQTGSGYLTTDEKIETLLNYFEFKKSSKILSDQAVKSLFVLEK